MEGLRTFSQLNISLGYLGFSQFQPTTSFQLSLFICLCLSLAIRRYVDEKRESVFGAIEDLGMENDSRLSTLVLQDPALRIVENELLRFWEEEAEMGRKPEELAR